MTTFVVVPQWQGSGSSRAMRLVDGAEAIRGDLPASATIVVDVPLESGDAQGSGILRLSSVQAVRERVAQALAALDEPAILIGGDCSAEWGSIERFAGQSVALVWLDAHPDCNSPESSPSGAFHGMVVRRLVDDGFEAGKVVLAGTRSFDEAESAWVAEVGIAHLPVAQLTPDSLVAAIEATGAASVYLHIDLDVLDPDDIAGIGFPEPFGVKTADLLALIRAVTTRFPVVGSGITEFAPASSEQASDDLPTILRIIGALSA